MLKVKKKCCGKCLFSKDKIVSNERKKDILKSCASDDSHFVCHETTVYDNDGDAVNDSNNAVCAEFYKRQSSQMIRISQRLGMVKMVD